MKKEHGKSYYPIFGRKGKASYYVDGDKIHVYDWAGNPVAFIEHGAIYSFALKHLGWLDEGWLRDHEGKCVGFTEGGPGGPNPPKTKPPATDPAEKKEPPEKPEVKEQPPRAPRRAAWSNLTEDDLFKPKK